MCAYHGPARGERGDRLDDAHLRRTAKQRDGPFSALRADKAREWRKGAARRILIEQARPAREAVMARRAMRQVDDLVKIAGVRLALTLAGRDDWRRPRRRPICRLNVK
jgi:hypothetical protein